MSTGGAATEPVRVGLVGCGVISRAYIDTLASEPAVKVVACADMDAERAAAAADRAGARPMTVDGLLGDADVELVLNLTPPAAHAPVALAALAAGKHVYGEKPFATDRSESRSVLAAAAEHGLRVGCAPDTFLGPAWQAARRVLDAGTIGRPVAARATFQSPGPESWHPDPAFFFAHGGGPLLDMGPYYVSALVALLGPVASVAAAGRITRPVRTVGSGPKAGTPITVDVPTHVAALLRFAGGAVSTLVTSFDIPDVEQSIQLWGTEGTLVLPDPNSAGGEVRVRRAGEDGPGEAVAGTGDQNPYPRGAGLVDLALALRAGTPHRASAELASHVLDVLLGILDADGSGAATAIETTCDRPAPLGETA